jgi:hypothetical protein
MNKKILILFIFASLMLMTPITAVARENKLIDNFKDQPDAERIIIQIMSTANKMKEKYNYVSKASNTSGIILNLLSLIVRIFYYIIYYMVWIPFLYIAFFIFLLVFG